MIRVTTENGSVYVLDTEAQTWERLSRTGQSGLLRSDGGPYRGYIMCKGQPLVIVGPPLNPFAYIREIHTSPVTRIERDEDGTAG